MKTEDAILELERPDFNRNRLRAYSGNLGEIIAQEVLRKHGFEVYLTRPVAGVREYLHFLRLPKFKLDELHRFYKAHSSDYKEKVTWEQYLKIYRERFIRETRRARAFLGKQRKAFEKYTRRLENESIEYRCDLLAKKSDQLYVIEVKSTKGAVQFLREDKLKGLMLAREYGFIPAIVMLDLRIEASVFKMVKIDGTKNATRHL